MRSTVTAMLLATVLLMAVPMLLPALSPAIAYGASHGGTHGGHGGGHSTPLNNLWYPFVTFGGLAALVVYTTRRPKG